MSFQGAPLFQSYPHDRQHEIDDLDEVALREDRTIHGHKFKAGIRGTVVAVYAGGGAYDVEFDGYDSLVFVAREDIGLVRQAE